MSYSMVNLHLPDAQHVTQLSCVASEMNPIVLITAHHYALCQPHEVNPQYSIVF